MSARKISGQSWEELETNCQLLAGEDWEPGFVQPPLAARKDAAGPSSRRGLKGRHASELLARRMKPGQEI